MSTKYFKISKHVIPASHIREYRGATREEDGILQLAVNQYTPVSSVAAEAQQITIIGAHANAFPKELYEPLWDDLYAFLNERNIVVANIFIADITNQGASGKINQGVLGNDPSWMDHPRDLLAMVNHFRADIRKPIIGIGHSMGGNNLVNLALLHPRLLDSLILIDPVIQPEFNYDVVKSAKASVRRRQRWDSQRAAQESFARSPFYAAWDPRVLALWSKHGIEECTGPGVELVTPRDQEVMSFLRFNNSVDDPFSRVEITRTFSRLPDVLPSVLYIHGGTSEVSRPAVRAERIRTTGTGESGSGGVVNAKVKEVVFDKIGHLIPMEVVRDTAEAAGLWITDEMAGYAQKKAVYQGWSSSESMGKLSPAFVEALGKANNEQAAASKRAKLHKL